MTRQYRLHPFLCPEKDQIKETPCDHPGCQDPGLYRAPKKEGRGSYYHFCLPHVESYNARWNFFEGAFSETPKDRDWIFLRSAYKISWKDPLKFFQKKPQSFSYKKAEQFPPPIIQALQTIGIQSSSTNWMNIQKKFREMAKKNHPDLHPNRQDKEETFKKINDAYHQLKNYFIKNGYK
jgi:hypothetical protein